MMKIESLQNAGVKRLLNLQQKSKLRKQENLFVVEGKREVARALMSGYDAVEIWFADEKSIPEKINANAKHVLCSSAVFAKISYRADAAEVVAVFRAKNHDLANLSLPENPLIVVLENIEKPGNIGAVLRTCNALQADAVFVCDSNTDLHNPNIIRNSLGGFFDIKIISTTSESAIQYFKENNIQLVTTHLEASVDYLDVNFVQPTALVFGTEATGITDLWVKHTDQNVRIEMAGVVDSLNISVAVSIILSEAVRQRKAPNKIRGLTPNQ